MEHLIYTIIGVLILSVVTLFIPDSSIIHIGQKLVEIFKNNFMYGVFMTFVGLATSYFVGGVLVYALWKEKE